MVSFSCEGCGDILTKKKLDPHRNQCYGASFTCIDCMVHFQGTDYRAHTSCMSEAQKYQGHLYRGEKKGKGGQRKDQALVPHKALEPAVTTVAAVNVPPRAPTPPPNASTLPPGVNVFDFLVSEGTPAKAALPSTAGTQQDGGYQTNGYSYGTAPIDSTLERYDSQASLSQPPYVTPASKRDRDVANKSNEKNKSDKKRKRAQVDDLDLVNSKNLGDRDMADATPGLHTGLTGGLNRMLSGPDFGHSDAVAPSPLSPKKRSKKEKSEKHESSRKASVSTSKSSSSRNKRSDRSRRDSSSSGDDARSSKKITSANARQDSQLVTYHSPAELFLSFINKGPESERGLSINKALKRYHREQQARGERDDADKDLWKGLRIRKNERGEYVLFA